MSDGPKNPALVVVDMLNTYDHEDADELTANVEPVVPRIRALLDRAEESGIEVIYVNDNYGNWNSSAPELVERACDGARPDLVEPIVPPDDASFVIKARHTIFFETPLGYLIQQKEIDRLILTGQVTEQCILYSALDAYVRHIPIAVPRDAVAHIHEGLAEAAIEMMERNMRADIAVAEECRFS
ncbi:MAG TPA: isochorismatase family cysteine hydrolase [Thermoleophilaceae bacterium]|nr:isochorismatase family cysteine hydrolase [Thermoleophilaceae bacterium]